LMIEKTLVQYEFKIVWKRVIRKKIENKLYLLRFVYYI